MRQIYIFTVAVMGDDDVQALAELVRDDVIDIAKAVGSQAGVRLDVHVTPSVRITE